MKIATTLMLAAATALIAVHEPKAPPSAGYRLVPIPESAVHRHDPRVRESEANGTSSNWSGYAVETNLGAPQSNAVTDVAGSWTVPTVTRSASKSTYSSNWVGIDGYSDGTVEQLGTEHDWSRGGASYYAWIEMYPNRAFLISGFPVVPGDTITASVHYAGGSFVLTITNVTQNNATFTSLPQTLSSAQRSSAEWIAEAPSSGRVLPLANFGTTTFSGCTATINGHTGPIDDAAWQNDAITMKSKNVVKATPSPLTDDASGSGFGVTWSHE